MSRTSTGAYKRRKERKREKEKKRKKTNARLNISRPMRTISRVAIKRVAR